MRLPRMMPQAPRHGRFVRPPRSAWVALFALALAWLALAPVAALELTTALMPLSAASAAGKAGIKTADKAPASADESGPSLTLDVGDAVSMQVYGRPELSLTTYVADDGTISIPLAGKVPVAGLAPADAAQRVAEAFRKGKLLIDPQVTLSPAQFRGQQVSVLGAVRTPGRFVIESKTTVLDVLAQAGGTTENGADVVLLLRPDRSGKITRHSINLKGLDRGNSPLTMMTLRGGDSILVPPADQFYINGEVKSPNTYRLEPGMKVIQAIARGGGVTPRGSSRRIEITRRKPDGNYVTHDGEPNDAIQANDVIRIKERLF